jgi:hypothetical protein
MKTLVRTYLKAAGKHRLILPIHVAARPRAPTEPAPTSRPAS